MHTRDIMRSNSIRIPLQCLAGSPAGSVISSMWDPINHDESLPTLPGKYDNTIHMTGASGIYAFPLKSTFPLGAFHYAAGSDMDVDD